MDEPKPSNKKIHPIRRAILTGLAVVLPPLLTIVIFVWVGSTIKVYLLDPVEICSRWMVRESIWQNDIQEEEELVFMEVRDGMDLSDPLKCSYCEDLPPDDEDMVCGVCLQNIADKKIGYLKLDNTPIWYVRVEDGRYIPEVIHKAYESDQVMWRKVLNRKQVGGPAAEDYFDTYVELVVLPWQYLFPVFFVVFVILLYLLGRFLAAGAGNFMWKMFEDFINRLPLIRNVYGTVKQVTDMVFTESSVEFTRVVAVEYPRKGLFSLGLVTGESFLDLHAAANEPVVSVLMPTSPLPMTGFTVTFKKSETIDLDITIDQAIQFIMSCGVVVPPHQMMTMANRSDGTEEQDSNQQAAVTGPTESQD